MGKQPPVMVLHDGNIHGNTMGISFFMGLTSNYGNIPSGKRLQFANWNITMLNR